MRLNVIKSISVIVFAMPVSVFSANVQWTDWISASEGNPGSATGSIILSGSSVISVNYTGEVTFAQTSTDTNYYIPETTYISTTVENPPSNSDMIAISGENTSSQNTITFSSQVTNPVMAIVSLGQSDSPVNYEFNVPFNILSQGEDDWGSGSLSKVSSNILQGSEGSGVIQFIGTFNSISWTVSTYEFWHGFTVGIQGASSSSCFTQADIDAARLAGRQECINNPSSCGITVAFGGSPATIDSSLSIHIPNATYQPVFGSSMNLWVDLQFLPGTDGSLMWHLSNYGVNQ